MSFFGTKGTEIGSRLGACIKDNPMPFFLIATGIGWMMFGPRQRRASYQYDRRSYETGYVDDGHSGAETFSTMGDKIQSGAAAGRQRLGESTQTAKETLKRTGDKVKETVGRTTDAVRGQMNRTVEIAQSQAKQARKGFSTLLEEQPFILGAIGLAVGRFSQRTSGTPRTVAK